jgi:adenine-specific DNA-methyltransferase
VRQLPLLEENDEGFGAADPIATLRAGKMEARDCAEKIGSRRRLWLARAFSRRSVVTYWRLLSVDDDSVPLAALFEQMGGGSLPPGMTKTADSMATAASRLDPVVAGYFIGTTYAAMLPKHVRSRLGAYYTPPALADRLLDQASAAGVDWAIASILDPACGGGAFLAPVAARIIKHLSHLEPDAILCHINGRLRGFEIDPFAAWLAQVFLNATLLPLCRASKQRPETLVEVRDALINEPDARRFDAVIGNPPYGRVTLSPLLRRRYARSLYGHANLYGVFTDMALRWTSTEGVVSFVTPASFLAGQYFRRLRSLLAGDAPPASLDFVVERKGVFDDVLQEAVLVTYSRRRRRSAVPVHLINCIDEHALTLSSAGTFALPADPSQPWLLPRSPELQSLVVRLRDLPYRLADWGYAVSTGPLVWNRHKRQLRRTPGKKTLPLIWAEAVTPDGSFVFRAAQRAHQPYFQLGRGDDWLVVREPVVLLQRTTAKEQSRRLIAAELPEEFLAEHGGAVVENHLNMIRSRERRPAVSPGVVTAFLNSRAADKAFRCLNGSVAVSAYELEAMPLPPPAALAHLEVLVSRGAVRGEIEQVCERLYGLGYGHSG